MKRHGSMLVELMVAATVLGAAAALCVELLGTAVAQRRANADRQLAAQEAANLMERLAAMPLAELKSDKARQTPLSPAAGCLSGAKADIEITAVEIAVPKGAAPESAKPESAASKNAAEGEPKAVRVSVAVRWEDRNGRPQPPVRLVAWRYL